MPASLVGLQILLILLPGLASAYVVQALATRRAQSDLERIIEGLVFSFVIYVCFTNVNKGNLPFRMMHDSSGKSEDSLVWEPSQLTWLVAVTTLFTLAAVLYVRLDGNRIFRAIKLTERTTHNSIWNDIFEHEAKEDQIVQVELGDKRSILGILLYYSDSAEDCSIYLKQASWVAEDGSQVPIPGPGILLTKSSDIRSVSLLADPEPMIETPEASSQDEPTATPQAVLEAHYNR